MATVLAIAVPLMKLIELLVQVFKDKRQDRSDEAVIRSLHRYLKQLEKVVNARKNARRHINARSQLNGDDDRLQDDGFRRD